MATIQTNHLVGRGRSYTVRWRGPLDNGTRSQENRTFSRRVDAEAFRAQIEADISRRQYIDPRGGRITLGEWIRSTKRPS